MQNQDPIVLCNNTFYHHPAKFRIDISSHLYKWNFNSNFNYILNLFVNFVQMPFSDELEYRFQTLQDSRVRLCHRIEQ